jgi:hypothetical protein
MMHQQSIWKLHGFYGDPSEVLVIDANPFRRQDIYFGHSNARGVAVSVVLGTNGHPIALPLQRGVTGTQLYKHSIDQPPETSNARPLEQLLDQYGNQPIMIDVAGTSPRLIDAVITLIDNQDCINRVCCGSRFDAVGEALALRLPQALHFMPRATRARLTLSLMLDSTLPDVSPFCVINLPMMFEGLKMVSPKLIERMNRMGIRLNVISNNDLEEQVSVTRMSVDALIVNLTPSPAATSDVAYNLKNRFASQSRGHQSHYQ